MESRMESVGKALEPFVDELEKGPSITERMAELLELSERLQALETVQKSAFAEFCKISNELVLLLCYRESKALQKVLDLQQKIIDMNIPHMADLMHPQDYVGSDHRDSLGAKAKVIPFKKGTA